MLNSIFFGSWTKSFVDLSNGQPIGWVLPLRIVCMTHYCLREILKFLINFFDFPLSRNLNS